MYVVSIPLPDEYKDMLVSAFCSQYGYQATVPDEEGNPVPNPITAEMFTQDKVAEFMLDVCKAYTIQQAVSGAREAATAQLALQEQAVTEWFMYVRQHGEEPPPGEIQSFAKAFGEPKKKGK